MVLESGFSVIGAKNARRVKGDTENVSLDVLFEGHEGYVPFTASKNDNYDHGLDLFERAESGEFGPIEEIEDTRHITRLFMKCEGYLAKSKNEISHLQDCIDIGEETPEERVRWLELKKFRVTIERLRKSEEWPNVTLPEYPESSK